MDKKKRINKKVVMLKEMSLLLGLCTSLSLTGCSKNNSNHFNDFVSSISDDTCYDDIINSSMLDDVSLLEEYIYLSDMLHYLPATNIRCKNIELLKPDQIRELVSKDSKELIIQNSLVNEYISKYGSTIVEEAALIGIKAKVADTVGIPVEDTLNINVLDKNTYDMISLQKNKEILIGGYDIFMCTDLINLLNSIYDLQDNNSLSNGNKSFSYNEERNKLLLRTINNLRIVLSNQYVVTNNKRIKKN